MSFNLKELIQYMASHNHTFFAHTPVVYHCHHFNLFLDQTIDDALGSKQGLELRTHAAQEATYNLLESICHFAKIKLPLDRIQVASTVFAAMGHGSLHFSANQRGGTVRGDYTHYGFSWKDKYGKAVRRTLPADAFGAGYAAAAVEVAYDLPLGSLKAEETTCIATGAPNCEFTLSPSGTTTKRQSPVRLNETKKALKTVFHGDQEETIANIARGSCSSSAHSRPMNVDFSKDSVFSSQCTWQSTTTASPMTPSTTSQNKCHNPQVSWVGCCGNQGMFVSSTHLVGSSTHLSGKVSSGLSQATRSTLSSDVVPSDVRSDLDTGPSTTLPPTNR